MSSLFKRSETESEERLKYLSFLEEVTKLMIFQEKEIKLYDEIRAKYVSSTSVKASEKILEATYRLYQAASRLSDTIYKSYFTYSKQENEYHINPLMPSAISKCVLSWKIAFDYFSGAAFRTFDSCKMGGFPGPEVQEYLAKSAMYRTEAIKEIDKLSKRLKLSDDERKTIHTKASKATQSEKWYPYW